MAAQFQLYRDENAASRFSLVTVDGTVIFSSKAFADEAAASEGIAAVRDIAVSGVIVDCTADPLASERSGAGAID